MIGIVAVQASHLAHLVTDVGLLARDELDTVDLRLERIEGRRLVADSIRAVFDVASGDLPVKAVVEPYLELVGDRARLIQLLAALLVNAHRHGSHILVMITRGDGSRSIEVHDDGPGVPAGFEQVMWERFERHGEGAPNRSGLGLALVRGIARAHGGKAGHRRSERLGGACFTVELPYTDHPAPREGAAAGAE